MRLVGYSDRLSAAPGDKIEFKVSSEHPAYEATIVRLIHGDLNPLGPGFIEREVATGVTGTYPGREQRIVTGSYAVVPHDPALSPTRGFTITAWIMPTKPDHGTQGVLTKWNAERPAGYALVIEEGMLALWLVDGDGLIRTFRSGAALRTGGWYFVAASVDAESGRVLLVQQPIPTWPLDASHRREAFTEGRIGLSAAGGPLLMAALAGENGAVGGHFNGKLDRPSLFARGLSIAEIELLIHSGSPAEIAGAIAAWDFSREIASARIVDASGNGRHGTLVNLPTRAVRGANWSGEEASFTHRPEEYGAIHFHDDDLVDAGWETDFTFTIPDDLPSGVYAARLRAGEDEDHLPFVVSPPLGTATAAIGYLIPTFTYLAYANEHMPVEPESLFPFLDRDAHATEYRYIAENKLNSTYDTHSDGSGVCYASWKRPLVNTRPKATFRIYSSPERLGADLYLTHWLEQKGIAYDAIADEELHVQGASLLANYRVIVTGSHPEYWTTPMMAALDAYLEGGGRIIYLGGNGFYWVTGVDPERPHVIEIRRWAGTGTWKAEPGEFCLSTTGEQGGLWRHRNREPQKRLGIGFTAQGNDFSRPYVRTADSHDPRAAFIFEGIEGDTLGDFASLMLRHGAAGYEIDRADFALGTPPHALVLASATGFSNSYQHVIEEMIATDDMQGGEGNPFVRADIVFFEGPNGGAVFSVGSIAWGGALSFNGGDNDVSRMTENVLRRFSDPAPFVVDDGAAP
jgi:N,N-dimethylformamidase